MLGTIITAFVCAAGSIAPIKNPVFSSTTQNPYADRNKGRICIGEINFVTYDI